MIVPSKIEPVTITLYRGVPFDKNYSDHFFRPPLTQQGVSLSGYSMEDILGNEFIYPRFVLSGTFNFNYNNGLVTNVILEVSNDFDSANYMVVTSTSKTFYYFITNVTILNHSNADYMITCKYDLELDVIATYQNEFMNSIKNYPVEVERKHCQRFPIGSGSALPYCSDMMLNEEYIGQCNPNIIKKVVTPNMNIENLSVTNVEDNRLKLKDIKWLYISASSFSQLNYKMEGYNGLKIPNVTIIIPLVTTFKMTWDGLGTPISINVEKWINEYYDNVGNYTAKISPYPPFNSFPNANITLTYGTDLYGRTTSELTLDFGDDVTSLGSGTYLLDVDETELYLFVMSDDKSVLILNNQNGTNYRYNYVPLTEVKSSKPTTSTSRDELYEVKMLFSPYTKYIMSAQYGIQQEIHPESAFSQHKPKSASIKMYNTDENSITYTYFSFLVTATAYGGDLTFSAFPTFATLGTNTSTYYRSINRGFINSPSYIYPIGSDALKTFQQTQQSSFTTQKVGQTIGGVLSVAGGIAGILTGHAVAGGLAIAGGVASIGKSISTSYAKYDDLANTPDTMSNVGANAVHDYAVGNTLHPYLVVYELSSSEKEMVFDYFYEYGYNVQRCCYFNTELYPSDYNDNNWVDSRIFTRYTFNYVKLSEDITNKITDNTIPFIVKQKLSNIFKDGIRLWMFLDKTTIGNIQFEWVAKLFKKDKENAEIY